MQLTLLYFARLRDQLGQDQETLTFTGHSGARLLVLLRQRGTAWADALAVEQPFRVAVNHSVVHGSHPLADGDEVAIFPPVTGG